MSNLKSGITLSEGEEMIVELQAELWATSSNIIARIIGAIIRIMALIFFGIRRKGYVVITTQRVIEVRQDIACWCFNNAKHVKYVLPSSVKEVGYMKTGTFLGCCCQAYHLYYDAFTQRTSVLLKGKHEEETKALVDLFYKTIRAAQ